MAPAPLRRRLRQRPRAKTRRRRSIGKTGHVAREIGGFAVQPEKNLCHTFGHEHGTLGVVEKAQHCRPAALRPLDQWLQIP